MNPPITIADLRLTDAKYWWPKLYGYLVVTRDECEADGCWEWWDVLRREARLSAAVWPFKN